MKKSSIGLLLLSVLICLSVFLASCSNRNDNANAPTESPTEESVPADVNIDPVTVLDKWNQYLTFSSPLEDNKPITSSELKITHYDYENEMQTSKCIGDFLVVTKADYEYYYGSYSGAVVSAYNYTVYSAKTGQAILTRTLDLDYTSHHNPSYAFSALSSGGTSLPILEVKKTVYDEFFYEYVSTYSYYNEKGEAIATDLDEKVYANYNSQDDTVTAELNGKIYVYDTTGEHIFTFEKGKEMLIPDGLFKFGDYYYIFDDHSVLVFNNSYDVLFEYKEDTALTVSSYVLSNGNILYAYENKVSKDAAHDFEADQGYENGYYYEEDYQLALSYVTVDVATGKTTEQKKDFVICDMLSEAMKEETGIGFKDTAHQLAVIRKIENGILSNNEITVILDSTLNIVEELPLFVKAQTNVYRMIDADKLLISADNYDQTQVYYYTVDINTKKVELFVNIETIDNSISNAFIKDGKLYNFDAEELMDLTNYSDYSLYSDFLILQNGSTYLYYVSDGNLVEKTIINGSGSYEIRGDLIIVTEDDALLDEDDGDESWYYDTVYKIYNLRGELLKEFSTNKPIVVTYGDGYAWIKSGGASEYADIYYLK